MAMSKELAAAKNIANPKEIDEALDEISKRFSEAVAKWIKTVARNHLVRDLDTMFHEVSFKDKNRWEELTGEPLPDWAKKALFSGKTLHVFVPDATFARFKDKLEHAAVYLQTLTTDLSRIPFDAAVKEGDKLMRQGIKKRVLEETPIPERAEVIYRCSDGFSWVNLPPEALEAESDSMGHCVGNKQWGYVEGVENKTMEIWSLRDPGNYPHCTMQYMPPTKKVAQIKGKENRGVVERYAKYLVEFLNSQYFHGRVSSVNEGEMALNCIAQARNNDYFSYFDPPDSLEIDQYRPDMSDARGQVRLPRRLDARSVSVKLMDIKEGTQTKARDSFSGRTIAVENKWEIEGGVIGLDDCDIRPMGRIELRGEMANVSETRSSMGMKIAGFSFHDPKEMVLHSTGISGKCRVLVVYQIHGRQGGNNIVFDVETDTLHLEDIRDCSGTIKYRNLRPVFSIERIQQNNPNLELVQVR
jgi:hypothetical protein